MTSPPQQRIDESARPSQYHGQRMPLEEYLALPEEKPYLEWWDGVVLQKAVTTVRHGRIQMWIGRLLSEYSDTSRGVVSSETHTWFEARGYRLPDVSYWSPEKPVETAGGYGLPPTLAVEIRSPGNRRGELEEKCGQMSALGVDECWLVLPDERAVAVYRAGERVARLEGPEELRPAALPGFALSLPRLFSVLDQ